MSGGILGFLRVNLAMDSAQFGAGAKNARRDMAAIGKAAKATGAAVAAFGVALGAFSAKTAAAAVDLQDMARGANASMGEFQRAAGAARNVGIEQEKFADILRDVNDRIGDFITTGAGPMADFFENIAPKVGVTAEQFAKLSGPDALQLYVSSLEKAGVGQQEMIFYLEAMASDASKLLPLLADGGAEFKRLGDEAGRYGLLTDQSAAAGRNMREAMTSLAMATTAVGAALVDSGVVDAMADLVRATADFIGLKVAPALRDMGAALKVAFAETAPLGMALSALSENMDRTAVYAATAAALFGGKLAVGLALAAVRVLSLVGAITALKVAIARTGVGLLVVGLGELVVQLSGMRGKTSEAEAATDRLVEAMGDEIEQTGHLKAALDQGIQVSVDIAKQKLDEARARFENVKAIIEESRAQALASGKFAELSAQIRESQRAELSVGFYGDKSSARKASAYEAQQAQTAALLIERGKLLEADQRLSEQQLAAAKNVDTLTAAIAAQKDGIVTTGVEIKKIVAGIRTTGGGGGGGGVEAQATIITPIREEIAATAVGVNGLASDLKSTLGSGLSGAFDKLISGGMKFRDVLGGIVSDLAKMMANRMITQLLDQVVGAALGSFGSQVTPSGFSTSSSLGGTPAFNLYADGTQFSRGGMAIVGERGPELVNLPQGSRVTPNHQMGGGGAVINVDARGATDPAAVEAAVRRAVPSIAAATSRATITDMRRRGEL